MIIIPDAIWSLMLREFQACQRPLEQVAYLDGLETDNDGIVTTVTFPNAVLRQGSFFVPAEAMSEAGRHLGKPLVRIAQVHTHPTAWVGHSPTDDERAYSRHDGAVSIILPNYGAALNLLSELGVHLCRGKTWRQLTSEQAKTFLKIVPSSLDFRPRIEPGPKTRPSFFRRLLRRFL